ncbi:MAG TPA: hypothetical protein VK272_12570 [Solirubrobacteraceae bacterium]|nr:hypothetical protein [Solirubrobacteraceae bacterium]
MSDYASSIQDEAQKPQPDKGKIARFVEKITTWAKRVGPPAATVLGLAAQIGVLVAAIA